MNRNEDLKLFCVVCLFLIKSCLVAFSQSPRISVSDQVDLHKIAEAKLSFFTTGDVLLVEGITDNKGRFALNDTSLSAIYLKINHPDYTESTLSLEEVKNSNFQIFLESRVYNFNEVVFTANKYKEVRDDIPFKINVIRSQEIAFSNPQTTADLLAQDGSIFVQKSQMGGGSPNIRGFEANKVLLVIDGIRMNNAIYRSGHLQNVITIDPGVIDRSEIMFGPGSVMYGSDALGGVMHFYTRAPQLSTGEKSNIKVNTALRYGSANQEKTFHTDLNLGYKKWGILTSISFSDFEDLRVGGVRSKAYPNFGKRFSFVERINGEDQEIANEDVNIQRGTAYSQYDIMSKAIYVPNENLTHTINLQLSSSTNIPRYDRLTQIRDGRFRFAEWYYGPQDRFLASYSLKFFRKKGIFDQLNMITAFQDIEESRHNRNFQSPIINHRTENVKIASFNLDANKALGNHEFAYGLEAAYNFVASSAFSENIINDSLPSQLISTRYPDGGSQMRFLAAYFTHRLELSKKVILTTGARFTDIFLQSKISNTSFFPLPFDEIKNNSRALSGNIGVVWQPGKDWRVSILTSTGFRAPNVDDVGKVFDSQPGMVVVPNADLKPEYTYNAELTLGKKFNDFIKIELTGFYTLYDDAIVVRDFQFNGADSIIYDGALSRVQANVNANRAFIYGVNANISAEWKHFSISNTLTYTYGQDITNDLPLDHITPLFGRALFTYQAKRFQSQISINYSGWKRLERFSPRDFGDLSFATPDGSPAWWTLNLKTSLAVSSQIKIQAGIENIFDLHYRPYSSRISAPGRNIFLALKTSF